MTSPKKIKINNKEFTITPMGLFQALRMDKKITQILAPVIGGLGGLKDMLAESKADGKSILDTQIDFDKLAVMFEKAIGSLSESDLLILVSEMSEKLIWLPKGGTPVQLGDEESLSECFKGDILGVYKMIFEVAKFNNFLPFALVGIGTQIKKITT